MNCLNLMSFAVLLFGLAACTQGNPACHCGQEGNQGNAMANLEARTGAATMYLYRPQWNHGQTCQQSFREERCLDWLMGKE